MTLSRRSRIALAALGLALVALALDRLVLPPPSSAAATENGPSRAAGQDERKRRGGALDGDGQWLARVAERIDAVRMTHAETGHAPSALARDPFGGATGTVESPAAIAERKVGDELAAARRFKEEHSLAATILGPDPIALVGRRTLRVGEALDGFRLVRVESGWAEFVSGDARVRLQVPPAGRNVRQ